MLRWSGVVWVCVSLPVITVAGTLVDSADSYIFVLIFMASGAYTTPALFIGAHALRHAHAPDRLAFTLLHIGLVSIYAVGLAMLAGLITGWSWANPLGVPAVVLAGLAHAVGLVLLVRRRSGGRALSVDIIEAVVAVVALTAPLVVLWWPTVVEAEAAWFTLPASVTIVFALWGVYWSAMLWVRMGPGWGFFELCAIALSATGTANAALQTAQGVAGFTLPAPPLIALHALCFSMYLLVPLNAPRLLRPGLDRLPPQAQVRGVRLPTWMALGGMFALLGATALVAGERPWAVPFALGVVSLLFVLGGFRHMAVLGETRRLYRRVEEASEERRRLVTQLLERSVHDRRDFASQLYEQAVAAYTSFRTLAGAEGAARGSPAVAEASAVVGGDLARQAESVRELMLALRPLEGERQRPQRLATPITAYLTSIYGDDPPPRLSISISDGLTIDWITETMVLQVVREAVHNVWRHSDASQVDLRITMEDGALTLRIADDGGGFDVDAVPEGSGLATMRASAAVVGGVLTVESEPGGGTTITARIGTERPAPDVAAEPVQPARVPDLRLVPRLSDD